MENASKALIIAGAILLSILIIGLGMYIFNMAQGAMSGANLDPQKIAAFNGQFESYKGENVKGATVKSLLSTIRSHNVAQEDETQRVGIEGVNERDTITAEDVSTFENTIKTGKTYAVVFSYDDKTGYISKVTITVNSSK